MKISKRLKSIANFVDSNTSFIDVGCDHALLSIYLVKNKNILKAVASDINVGPLNSARENIKLYNLEDKISLKLMDGINELESDINTIIISGMGGLLICDILNKGNLCHVSEIILSPNNDIDIVRKTLSKLGFYIDNEDFIKDKGKYYNIIKFKKGYKKYNNFQYTYGPILIEKNNTDYIEYLNNLLNKDIEILKSLPYKYIIKKIKLKREITNIKKAINR